ncbi:indole-3-glycerol phosphate synthase [Desulfocicer vacuolatum DSM 3385]|uniref:Multifunctional fusion protein n=1 Tax=Desulfocicer vacuolatum DSM 3385 TaxID=1121400 RepID=A0A1W2BEE0_9BACT|nr:bifunctional indole-3-glycerol-phosphate synthase TrpC/phosphoribosylanthranilate isomerase TrpF [Desulfocicer vacuolatum]SMC71393.1 indole-3-glycerol phosphate synthase [Desulfocicer vacuolatum DSM 3385]
MAPKGFLKTVIAEKKKDIARAMGHCSLNRQRRDAEARKPGASFLSAMEKSGPGRAGIIAEIKKASPSKGDIRLDLDPARYAKKYTRAGACAISILTEEHFFKGSLHDLTAVRRVTDLPILRKDFTISEYQIYEAGAAGADAVLLIVSILSRQQLQEYVALTREIGMEPLVEIHSEWELENALYANAKIIGINNRNLETLKTDTTVAARVVPFLTKDQIPVSASGVSGPDDIQKGMDAGLFNFLVGESIVRANDTEKFIHDLISTGNTGTSQRLETPRIKVCGLTRPHEAVACADLGAHAVGLVFYPKSPRHVTTAQAAEICRALPGDIITTGVFVDATFEFIMAKVKACNLKAVQLHGNESPETVLQLKSQGLTVFKALFAGKEPHIDKANQYKAASAILVEYGKGPLPGGNAETWDWGTAKQSGNGHKLIIAGGITPENVTGVISATSPWAVDVSSGVESAPGCKDLDRVKGLIQAVKTSPSGR